MASVALDLPWESVFDFCLEYVEEWHPHRLLSILQGPYCQEAKEG